MGDFCPPAEVAAKLSGSVQDYIRPSRGCSHCLMWKLDCIISQNNARSCYPCILLSRDCDIICFDEDTVGMSSATADLGVSNIDPMPKDAVENHETSDRLPPSSKAIKSSLRFHSSQTKVLKNWMRDHKDHPYPNKDDSIALRQSTGLSSAQISTWFANHRRRSKSRLNKRDLPRDSQVIGTNPHSSQSCDPLERWRNSPPETEPAAYEAIAQAMRDTQPNNHYGKFDSWRSSSSFGSQSEDQAVSEGSTESSVSIIAREHMRLAPSPTSSRSSESKLRARRKRRVQPRLDKNNDLLHKRHFQCTFCTDRFSKKHDWARHERALHLNLESWTCPGTAKQAHHSAIEEVSCVFCDIATPTTEHVENHSPDAFHTYNPSADGSYELRVFYRKDHLKQHLRLAHNVHKISDNIEKYWHEVFTNIRSRCGFCDQHFTTWDERAAHLAQEFRDGADMKDWKGSRGLDAAIEARVTFSMPPYLIDNETRSQNPFSASSPDSILHHRGLVQRSSKDSGPEAVNAETTDDWSFTELLRSDVATYWETFPFLLGQWAQEEIRKGVYLTDEMIQTQGRLIVFGCNDQWNQTEADHPGWLAEFKRVKGITSLTSDMLLEQATLDVQQLKIPTLLAETAEVSDSGLTLFPAAALPDSNSTGEEFDDLQQGWTAQVQDQLQEDWSWFGDESLM